MSDVVPRPEYPRPMLQRADWLNLNGEWELEYDPDDRGLAEHWERWRAFSKRIVVPFCIESEASGIHDIHPPNVVWYRRTLTLPESWNLPRVALHIGACDFETRVFVNSQQVGTHRGGYTPMAFDIAHVLSPGDNTITIRVEDSPSWSQPRGKQEGTFRTGIDYDSVTGIWQTVWLEPLPVTSIDEAFVRFERDHSAAHVHIGLSEMASATVGVELRADGTVVASQERRIESQAESRVSLEIPEPQLWSPQHPFIYDLIITLRDDNGTVDRVESYTGLREISTENGTITLNGEPLYLRGILDQGYFPGGWYTATDEQLKQDVELTLAMGLNCARKHQKVEDPRYLYWADRLGLLVWDEMPSGRIFSSDLVTALTDEWQAVVRRDRGHPCIITWVPFNESWGVWHQAERPQERAFVEGVVGLTKALDPTRPVVGNDGWEFSAGDLWTLHIYEGEPAEVSVADRLQWLLDDPSLPVVVTDQPIATRVGVLPGADVIDLPVLLTECGGVGYVMPGTEKPDNVFVYGDLPQTPEDLEARIVGVAKAVHDAKPLCGFVWTQLTDIQQEMNGLLDFSRNPKLPPERLRQIFQDIGARS